MRTSTKGRTFPPEPLSTAEIMLLLSATTRGHIGVRNQVAILLMSRSGVRVSELLALRPCDVDLSAGTIRVLKGKGSKPRTVGMDRTLTTAAVARWLAIRRARGIDGRLPLICDLRGRQLRPGAIRELLKRLRLKAGIQKRVHAHGMRHTFAAVASRQMPLTDLQAALGHADLTTTAIYARSLGSTAVDAVQSLRW